jgi:hypothetical protein
MKILARMMTALLAVSMCSAQDKAKEPELKDGFLEKDYSVESSVFSAAKDELTKGWLPLGVGLLGDKGSGGIVITYAVADEEGELVLGTKGSRVQIKTVDKTPNLTTLGIKVGNGDMVLSEKLHKRFQELLDSHSKPAEKQAPPKA